MAFAFADYRYIGRQVNVQTYLYFPGTGSHAIEVYKQALGAELLYLARYADAPEVARLPGSEDLVFHATLRIGTTLLNLSDEPSRDPAPFSRFALLVHLDSSDAVDTATETLSKDGIVQLFPQATFWATRCAIVTDAFGLTWKLQHSASVSTGDTDQV